MGEGTGTCLSCSHKAGFLRDGEGAEVVDLGSSRWGKGSDTCWHSPGHAPFSIGLLPALLPFSFEILGRTWGFLR